MIFNYALRTIGKIGFLALFLLLGSCKEKDGTPEKKEDDKHKTVSIFELGKNQLDNSVFYNDTILVFNSKDLVASIASNRMIKLLSTEYLIQTGLSLNNIKNLRIEGSSNTKIRLVGAGSNVILIQGSHNIQMDSLIVEPTDNLEEIGESGVLRIEGSYNISLNNSLIFGRSGFGLVTDDVLNFKFINSEIRECSKLIFDLAKSRKCYFSNAIFQDNDLGISVLGGFTFATREVYFTNCLFENNRPKQPGNPVFNFMENTNSSSERIVFKDCSFKNNKGYKWYGEKMELIDCEVDSNDFVDFH